MAFESTANEPMLLGPRDSLSFFDRQAVILPVSVTALEAWRRLMAQPMPVMRLAFKLRDALVAPFGVKQIRGFSGTCPDSVSAGDMLDFFLVEEVSDTRLVLTERDRHLDVMTCITVHEREVAITSSVKTHNWLGRIYMIPVAPIHKLIVSRQLKRLCQET